MEELTASRVEGLACEIRIPPGREALPEVLERRLAICASCPDFQGGIICGNCGCLVRFRARIRDAWCPNPEGNKWA